MKLFLKSEILLGIRKIGKNSNKWGTGEDLDEVRNKNGESTGKIFWKWGNKWGIF